MFYNRVMTKPWQNTWFDWHDVMYKDFLYLQYCYNYKPILHIKKKPCLFNILKINICPLDAERKFLWTMYAISKTVESNGSSWRSNINILDNIILVLD